MNWRGEQLLQTAFWWQRHRVSAVPAMPKSKECHIRWRNWETMLPGAATLRTWFAAGMNNLALVCGSGGLLVLDFETLDSAVAFGHRAGDLSQTYAEETGRGLHLFYLVDRPITRRFVECEALGLGHLCLAAPSIHPSGKVYRQIHEVYKEPRRVETAKLFSLLSEIPVIPDPGQGDRQPGGIAAPAGVGQASNLVEKVKAAISILDMANQVTKLKPSGGNGRFYIGACPFHEDHHPSFWVDACKGLYGCFTPGCSAARGGDVINLYGLIHHCSTIEAIQRLAREIP